MKTKRNAQPKIVNTWSDEDRQAFADRNILRSKKIPNRKRIADRNACRGRIAFD